MNAHLLEQLDQQIVCLYFQSQQKSYLVNRYNRAHPNNQVEQEEQQQQQQQEDDDDADPLHDADDALSEYEKERRRNIARNLAFLEALGISDAVGDMA